MSGRKLDSYMDKICKNCEHFSGDRQLKRFLGSPTVDVRYRKENICVKTGHSQPSGDCRCNCNQFKTWCALQNEIDKIKEEKERKREIERERLNQVRQKHESSYQFDVDNHESKHISDAEVKLMETQMKETRHNRCVKEYEDMKKLKVVPIIFSVLGTLMLILGIVLKVIANNVSNSNANSSSYYAKQNQSNAATTSTLGTVFIVISIICIIVPWLIWFYKYSKAKKAVEEI